MDHIIPKSRGGKTIWENVVTACPKCNNKKGARTLKEAGMKLVKKPEKPKYSYYPFISYHNLENWKKYFEPENNAIEKIPVLSYTT